MRETLRLFAVAALARTYPRVAWMFRSKVWLLQETVLPLLSVAAFSFVYEAMIPDKEVAKQYVGIVVLGQAMSVFWTNVLWSMGAHLYWERDSGNLELYIMSPAPMMGVLAGMALGGMTTTVVRAGVIVAGGMLLLNVPVNPTSWLLLALVFSLTMAALYGLGMMFASVFLIWGREAWHTVNLLQEPVYLATGMNFPVKVLGQMLHTRLVPAVALLIPLTAGMDGMRQVLFQSEGFIDVWYEVALLAGLAVVFLSLARGTLRRMEQKARNEGTLTVKWQ